MRRALFLSMSFIGDVLAAGGSGSVTDLKFAAINFVVLFAFIILKVRKPLTEMFNKNSEDVEELYGLATERDREAQIKLDMFKNKMKNIESECNNIIEKKQEEARAFERRHGKETDELIDKLVKEMENKIKFGEAQIKNKLYRELIEDVIAKTKSTIDSDKTRSYKATSFLLSKMVS